MKNQSDIICIAVCALLSIIFAVAMFFMKREPSAYPTPSAVVTTPPTYPAGAVTYVNNLSGGSGGGGGQPGGGFGMGMGGPGGRPGVGATGMGGPGGPGMPGGKGKRPPMSGMKVGL